MPDTTVVITGATDGLGRALATQLAGDPSIRLILHGRSRHRLDAVSAELIDFPARVDTVLADLSELIQVRRLADEISSLTDHVSVLINNAGIGAGLPDSTTRQLTIDGNELRLAVNYLAPFALTQRLLPLLDAGAPARIVNVASIGQSPIDFDDLTLSRGYSGQRAYGQSKLALITYSLTLAQTLDPSRVTVNSLHPATYMPTKMVLDSVGYSIDSLESGLTATLRLVTDPALTGTTGRFYDGTTQTRAHANAYRTDIQKRLWEISEQLTN